jgi:hypothetical protein
MEKEPPAQGQPPLAQTPPVQQPPTEQQPPAEKPPVVDWETVGRALKAQEETAKEATARLKKLCEDAAAQALKGFQEAKARMEGRQ